MDASSPHILNRFRDPDSSRKLIARIHTLWKALQAERGVSTLNLMEVCGTHTVALAKAGIRSVLPEGIRLLSGPGCPVCVTAGATIDCCIAASSLPGSTLATFGDMMRVPGSRTSLQECRAKGASVEVVYSPLDALALALRQPERQIIFIGVGFETTTPLIAATIKRAAEAGADNFSVLAAHKRVVPALHALAQDGRLSLQGFLLPGHVSTIIGSHPYRFLSERYGIPAVIAGFEPVDLLLALVKLLEQCAEGRPRVEIAYGRAVHEQGNEQALALIDEVFEVVDAPWRGLGSIGGSGHGIREEFARFDAAKRFGLDEGSFAYAEPKGCKCGDVLKGVLAPPDCALFGRACTPTHPVGPCMVSGEGSCAAYYKYRS